MKTCLFLIPVALLTVACSNSPMAPTSRTAPAKAPLEMDYDINIPSSAAAFEFRYQFPDGIRTSPLDAQHRWDYTVEYKGSPNVYFGETAPHCQYPGVGIVVAPHSVAGLSTFTAADWPGIGLEAGATYVWVGRFKYTAPAAPGTYIYDPTGAFCWRP